MVLCAGEKNAKSKEVVRAKVAEYMDRAEKLKTWLAEDGGNKKKPAAMGSNGKASGGGGNGFVPLCMPNEEFKLTDRCV